MKEECLLCGAPLAYLETDEIMECAVCHKKENSKTRCVNGHYICNGCHTRGMDVIIGLCLKESSKDPVKIVKKLMDQPFCHMHGPEHHVMVGGPRCCKRDSFLSILAAVDFVEQHFQVSMEKPEVVCGYSAQNNQCIGTRCPFSK